MTTSEQQIRAILQQHWAASAAGDLDAEHDIYKDDSVCEYPQSGERILGRENLKNLRGHHPGRPSGFAVHRISGSGNLWVTEYVIDYAGKPVYTVSVMEFEGEKCRRETQYFADPFDAPSWRAKWVEQVRHPIEAASSTSKI
jgi:ketosteroid isomerase-like protein